MLALRAKAERGGSLDTRIGYFYFSDTYTKQILRISLSIIPVRTAHTLTPLPSGLVAIYIIRTLADIKPRLRLGFFIAAALRAWTAIMYRFLFLT
uniref:Uncharacterized protein n=1 Tax=Candidatus Kentrum sp. TUN TaxID=2126343 RepID=A0A450ZMX4_9GAMM|nr:MAG: hypothetical protein BECKTUN1418D_GA0071000_10289 [Candidatus Kentron sp. TUN]